MCRGRTTLFKPAFEGLQAASGEKLGCSVTDDFCRGDQILRIDSYVKRVLPLVSASGIRYSLIAELAPSIRLLGTQLLPKERAQERMKLKSR